MAAFVKFQAFVENVAEKVHNLQSDALKIMLINAAPTVTWAVKLDATEISAGNGYTAGGATSTQSTSAQTSGTYKLVSGDTVHTAAGGSIGPFRSPIMYNDTPTSPADPLIGGWDYGSSITLLDTETFTTDLDGTNGVLTIA